MRDGPRQGEAQPVIIEGMVRLSRLLAGAVCALAAVPLYIPDSAQEKAQQGAVLAVGPGGRDAAGNAIPMQVKEGDLIYFGKYSGTEAGDDYLIIREDEILGVIEK